MPRHHAVMAEPTPITLDQLARFGVDQAHRLYWDGQEVVTTLALPNAVNWAIIAGAIIGGLRA